ncbi:MAG: bifunctional folylpolyglutamate synthase/dihydrofolate synthase [Bacteroidetes bacterium]|nr:bifunctional folylpolyglutamate synthase/dihydrofolate synthase [Bacteroidota bacterium]MCW5896267.1 bifunctional folylpolyglutamate synthase/dihydrofolate synthase [Bacteroidota bacterium]
MKAYNETLRFLYGLQSRGMKFGLRNIRALLKSVGNPERRFLSIHIAGTNGKGSTASLIASVLMESGCTTALYTSPHLVKFTERIRINGIEMPEQLLVQYARKLRPMIEQLNATFFEATTCIAFQYFADRHVDIAVVEAGLGGRLDSTNVLRPLVSVITGVSFDHMEYLGNTLQTIAREKGGIIKRHTPCVTGSTNPEVSATLRRICAGKKSPLIVSHKNVNVKRRKTDGRHSTLRFQSRRFSVSHVRLELAGEHQINNATTAFAAIDVLMRSNVHTKLFSGISDDTIHRGFEHVRANTGLRGRFERVGGRFVLDVAHNVEGLNSLAETISSHRFRNCVVVFGVMRDKQYPEMCEVVSRIGSQVIAVSAKNKRSLSSRVIAREVRKTGVTAIDAGTVQKGILAARKISRERTKIVITGSHYVVAEALKSLSDQITG